MLIDLTIIPANELEMFVQILSNRNGCMETDFMPLEYNINFRCSKGLQT